MAQAMLHHYLRRYPAALRMQAKTQIRGGGGKGTVTLFEAMGISYPDFDAHA